MHKFANENIFMYISGNIKLIDMHGEFLYSELTCYNATDYHKTDQSHNHITINVLYSSIIYNKDVWDMHTIIEH